MSAKEGLYKKMRKNGYGCQMHSAYTYYCSAESLVTSCSQVWFYLMTWLTEYVVRIKPGDFSVAIWYQVDEFICTWLAVCFIAQSNIYHRFTGKVSTLTHFLLELG